MLTNTQHLIIENCGAYERCSDSVTSIPGVGKSIAEDLRRLGVREVADLQGQSPEDLYMKLEKLEGVHVDRCMLYVMRTAVYYAEGGRVPERLLWWHWKDAHGDRHVCEKVA